MIRFFQLIAAVIALTVSAPAQESVLTVVAENFVAYTEDEPDPAVWASLPGPGRSKAVGNFARHILLADLVSVNGTRVKGMVVGRVQSTRFRPTPPAGAGVGDISRNNITEFQIEFLGEDGTGIGSLTLSGLGGVTPGVGSPTTGLVGAFAIVGGTGAFMGARGQGSVIDYAPRSTSITENPAERRMHPGAGAWSMVLRLVPLSRPEVLAEPDGAPAVFHADFSRVTAQNPARAGEHLIMAAAGLGPVLPAMNPGGPFPPSEGEKLHRVTSPLSVSVNGVDARVVNKVGWPTLTGVYRVDFVMPQGAAAGMAAVRLSAAWVEAREIQIHTR